MTEAEMDAMIEKAAAAGAKKALRDIGLSDEDANKDLQELRSVLDAWRMAKRTAGRAIVQTATYLFLGALMAGAYLNISDKQ
jgi:hypothetical protein